MSWKMIFVSNARLSIKSLWILSVHSSFHMSECIKFQRRKVCPRLRQNRAQQFNVRWVLNEFMCVWGACISLDFWIFSSLLLLLLLFSKQPDTCLKSRYLKIKRQNILNKFSAQTIHTKSIPFISFFILEWKIVTHSNQECGDISDLLSQKKSIFSCATNWFHKMFVIKEIKRQRNKPLQNWPLTLAPSSTMEMYTFDSEVLKGTSFDSWQSICHRCNSIVFFPSLPLIRCHPMFILFALVVHSTTTLIIFNFSTFHSVARVNFTLAKKKQSVLIFELCAQDAEKIQLHCNRFSSMDFQLNSFEFYMHTSIMLAMVR